MKVAILRPNELDQAKQRQPTNPATRVCQHHRQGSGMQSQPLVKKLKS